MGFFSKVEGKMEDTFEGAADKMFDAPISPVQIAKKAEKQMRREKMVGAGKQYAPTLYTVLVSVDDDTRMFSYYPTLAGEIETYLMAKANELGFVMDGQPLVRFIADPELKQGKFDVVAEMVASPIIARLRGEEMERYGIAGGPRMGNMGAAGGFAGAAGVAGGAVAAGVAAAGRGAANRGNMVPVGQQDAYGMAGYDDYYEEGAEDPDTMDFDDHVAQYGAPGVGAAADAGAAIPQSALDVYLYDEQRDTAYSLDGSHQRIGRESSNDIVVPDINVSRVHAEIYMQPNGSWVISDLGSTNGVYLNKRRVQKAPLRDADMITIGTTVLEFQQLS